MEEFVINLHIHSVYSDGSWTHQQIAEAGMDAGLDGLIITDHNCLVQHVGGYYENKGKQILVIIGEEIHDKTREPQKNHLLTFGQSKELCNYAHNPQQLITQVQKNGGLSFLAHPFESALPQVNETDITWEDWDVDGFTGIEIWNHLSELKNESKNWIQLLMNVFFPNMYGRGPHPLSLKKWDDLLNTGKKLTAVGGSDSHRLKMKKACITRYIFPYQFHFKCVNNHLLIPNSLSSDYLSDRKIVINAFQQGNSFIGYDLPAPTKGFRFYAQGKQDTASMGDEIELESSLTFQIKLPEVCECRLLHNGKIIKIWNDQEICTYISKLPGIYRVECYIQYLGKKRGWIFSNPIYVQDKRK